VLTNRAKNEDQVRRVVPHLVDDVLSISQYADDTIIFMDNDLEMAQNMCFLFLNSCRGLRLISIRARCSIMGAQRSGYSNILKIFGCDIGAHYLFDTWEFPCVTANSAIVIEDKLKRGFKNC
jgi:hypothetical protein